DLVGHPVSLAAEASIILTASRRIAQDLVGTRHVEERGAAIVPGNVGVIAARELPVRALDFVSARVRRYAQNVVVIAHQLPANLQKQCRRTSPGAPTVTIGGAPGEVKIDE